MTDDYLSRLPRHETGITEKRRIVAATKHRLNMNDDHGDDGDCGG